MTDDMVFVSRTLLAEIEDSLDGGCSFWACPGVDEPHLDMATCRCCAARQDLRRLLGRPVPEPEYSDESER